MESLVVNSRTSKYSLAIKEIIKQLGHTTNVELLDAAHVLFPDLSATTVHRITARLAERGVIAIAPNTHDGAMRYDANTTPHDHFMCTNCEGLRDIDIKDDVIGLLESAIDDCHISGRLTINGKCNKCKE